LNALVIGIALSLPAGGYALIESLRPPARASRSSRSISLFPRRPARRRGCARRALRADRRIASVRFVPRERR
jgi:cell division transport system permease protein